MKKHAVIILQILLLTLNLVAQDKVRQFKDFYQEGFFDEAKALIPEILKDKPRDEMLFVMFGDVYFELQKYDSAYIMYKNAFDIKNNRPEVVVKYSRGLSYVKQHNEAIKVLRDFLKKNPDNWEAILELGYVFLRADSLRQAEYNFTKAKEVSKKNPRPIVALGDLYFNQKVYELARWNFEEALAIDPNLTEARVKLATTYYYLANREVDKDLSNELFTRSLKEWQIVSQRDPKNASAWFEQGKILFLASRYEDAARALYQFVQLRPSVTMGRWYLAQALIEIGKCDSAEIQLEYVIKEMDTLRPTAYLKLARCYFDVKDFSNAIKIYTNFTDENLFESKDYERLASSYLSNGDTASAFKVYDRLFDKYPQNCQLIYQVGNLALFSKNYEKAVQLFSKIVNNCKNNSLKPEFYNKSLYFIGNAYLNTNKHDSAIYYFNLYLEKDSADILAFIYRADAYVNLNNKTQARNDYIQAINLINKDTEKSSRFISIAYFKLLSLLLEAKDYKEMLKYARRWTELEKESSAAWSYLAISHQGLKNTDEACKALKKVLQIDPKSEFANKFLQQLNCK